MVKKIDHIGIAVKNLDEQIHFYSEVLGLPLAKIETVEDQKVRVAIFSVGEVRIELLHVVREFITSLILSKIWKVI